jgi:non-specific serine/threonine protein kinase
MMRDAVRDETPPGTRDGRAAGVSTLPPRGGPRLLALPARLPAPATRLIGRGPDLARLRDLFAGDGDRLVTLTGPAGVGKTRLALALAADLFDDFADGAWFVSLDAIHDPTLVPFAIGRALGVREISARPPVEQLTDALRRRQALLVLDNFEQVLPAATLVAHLLGACPDLTMVVTSRAPLRLQGEREYPVPPLSTESRAVAAAPPLSDLPPWYGHAGAHHLAPPAVELFVSRARGVRPDFELTEANADVIAAICRQLDGLPLAIELAAARTKVLPPPALLERLEARAGHGSLDLLGGGARDLPARQRTLRDAIAWSYDLLSPAGQRLLRRLSVFVGGWTVDAAEAVCAGDGIAPAEVLDLLAELVDQSLVVSVEMGGEPRFRLLEMLRDFGAEQLAAADEVGAVEDRHTAYHVALAEAAAPELRGPRQAQWLWRLEADHDNLRTVLARSLERGAAATALRLVGVLTAFWVGHGYLVEGQAWTERALAAGAGAPAPLRARALLGLGTLAWRRSAFPTARAALEPALPLLRELGDRHGEALALKLLGNERRPLGDLRGARALHERSLAIYQELGDERSVAELLNNLAGIARDEGDLAAARSTYAECLAIFRRHGDRQGTGVALVNLGAVARDLGEYDAARDLGEEALAIYRAVGDRRGIGRALLGLGILALRRGEPAAARPLLDESLRIGRELNELSTITEALGNLGRAAHDLGEHALARDLYNQALTRARDLGNKKWVAESLDAFAALAADCGQPVRAVRLWGAADALREAAGTPRLPFERAEYDAGLAAARAALSVAAINAAAAAGRAMDMDEAVTQAHADTPDPDPPVAPAPVWGSARRAAPALPGGLSTREAEVLALIAAGHSNKEIAETLVVSPATVHRHVINIYQKLDVHGRAGATAYAFRHGLAHATAER